MIQKKCQSQTTGKGEGLKISEKGNIILHKGKQSGMKGTIKAKGFAPQGKRCVKTKIHYHLSLSLASLKTSSDFFIKV